VANSSVQIMWQRNAVVQAACKSSPAVFMALMESNTFQAGLDALDPECPCYVKDKGIAQCVYLGLMSMIDNLRDATS